MQNIEIMLVLVAIVAVGFMAGKLGYMGGDFDKKLSGLIIDYACPALILSSTMGSEQPNHDMVLPLLLISALTYVLLTAVALTLPRLLTRSRSDEGVVGFALMFGNVGFIGYPIAASIFGPQAVFYAAVLNVVNTFAVFTVGVMLINGSGKRHTFQHRVLYSSPMLAVYVAILIVVLGIDSVPRVVSQPLAMIGAITVPGALLIIGSSMAQLSARTMLGNATVYATTLFRLVLIPVALYFLFKMMGFSSFVVSLNTVIIAMPVATYGTILCLKHGRDTTLITELTFVTTLLSVLTIPMLAMIFK